MPLCGRDREIFCMFKLKWGRLRLADGRVVEPNGERLLLLLFSDREQFHFKN